MKLVLHLILAALIANISSAHDLEPPQELPIETAIDLVPENSPEVTDSEISVEAKDEESESVKPGLHTVGEKRPWTAPDYSNQDNALGYNVKDFTVTPELKERVQFWIDIYTKYTTDEGVLHDSLYVNVVYTPIDFKPIMTNSSLNDYQKRKAREKLVKDKKIEIKERLSRLSRIKTPTDLQGEDLRIWQMFETIDEPDKFRKATDKKRLRFQLGQRDRFITGIFYSGRYLQEMEKIFKEASLPKELTRLPFVESSFNVKARSHVGASGIWQFMRYTGKKFMRITPGSDERNDPLTATRAATKLMTLNFNILKKWPLAITAYNHGAGGVSRMVKKFGTDEISELVESRHRRFGFASANFYASFLAAVEVEKRAKEFFGDVYWDAPISSEPLVLSKSVTKKQLIDWFSGDIELAQEFNPHLTKNFWRNYARLLPKDFVRLPPQLLAKVKIDLDKQPAQPASLDADANNIYMVGQGETISDIAEQLGVSVRSIIELNDIENPRRIMPGQKLIIPVKKR